MVLDLPLQGLVAGHWGYGVRLGHRLTSVSILCPRAGSQRSAECVCVEGELGLVDGREAS